jgi:DNA-binding YbaB/EbfC family protein
MNPREMQRLQRQVLEAQAKMQEAQEKAAEELANMKIEGTAGGGAVVVTLSGDMVPQSVTLDPEAVDPEDVSTLEDLILVALSDALSKAHIAQEEAQQKVSATAMSGLRLPPGLGF